MFDDFKTLRMEHTSGLDARGNVWIEMPLGAAYHFGWIDTDGESTKHVVERTRHTVTIALPLDEISDAPRCDRCGTCTTDLHEVTDESGAREEWCRACEEEGRHAA